MPASQDAAYASCESCLLRCPEHNCGTVVLTCCSSGIDLGFNHALLGICRCVVSSNLKSYRLSHATRCGPRSKAGRFQLVVAKGLHHRLIPKAVSSRAWESGSDNKGGDWSAEEQARKIPTVGNAPLLGRPMPTAPGRARNEEQGEQQQ